MTMMMMLMKRSPTSDSEMTMIVFNDTGTLMVGSEGSTWGLGDGKGGSGTFDDLSTTYTPDLSVVVVDLTVVAVEVADATVEDVSLVVLPTTRTGRDVHWKL
jgi:hypothetical protein